MAKGGQNKGKALGKSKGSSSSGSGSSNSESSRDRTIYKPSTPPSSSISRPSPSTPKVRSNSKVSYGQGAKYSYTKEGKLIMPSKPIKITNKGRRQMTMNQAYCMKCRRKIEMKSPKQVTMKNGRPATQGTCPVCGTKVFRIRK